MVIGNRGSDSAALGSYVSVTLLQMKSKFYPEFCSAAHEKKVLWKDKPWRVEAKTEGGHFSHLGFPTWTFLTRVPVSHTPAPVLFLLLQSFKDGKMRGRRILHSWLEHQLQISVTAVLMGYSRSSSWSYIKNVLLLPGKNRVILNNDCR